MTPSPEFSTSMYNMHNSIAALFVPALVEPKHLSTKLGRTSDRVLPRLRSQLCFIRTLSRKKVPCCIFPAVFEQCTNSIHALLLRNGIVISDPFLPVMVVSISNISRLAFRVTHRRSPFRYGRKNGSSSDDVFPNLLIRSKYAD